MQNITDDPIDAEARPLVDECEDQAAERAMELLRDLNSEWPSLPDWSENDLKLPVDLDGKRVQLGSLTKADIDGWLDTGKDYARRRAEGGASLLSWAMREQGVDRVADLQTGYRVMYSESKKERARKARAQKAQKTN